MAKSSQGGEIVDLRDRVTVYATEQHQYAKPGEKLVMTKHLANYLAKKKGGAWVRKSGPKAANTEE